MLIVAFNMEMYFYHIVNNKGKQQWNFIGLVNLLDIQINNNTNIKSNKNNNYIQYNGNITSIKHIPDSDTYIISTTNKVYILYYNSVLSKQTNKLKVQIK